MSRFDLIIINRSFWPIYPVVGEALLSLAEKLVVNKKKVAVVAQNQLKNIKSNLKESNRGIGVKFFTTWAFSVSSSNLLKRILDSFFFMFLVLIVLIKTRPKKIYISTDPPILVPFIVLIYSKISNTEYIYHLQDIHPEATNTVLKVNSLLSNILKKIDNLTMRHASLLITLNKQMKSEIVNRSNTKKKIIIIENPSVQLDKDLPKVKKKGISFTGNLGRLQRIPLLIKSIKKYFQKGGQLEFVFAGGGVYSDQILKLSNDYPSIKYYGSVSSEQAAIISSSYEWALAPIEDKITHYAFPSKLATYACTEAKILAICSEDTSVANWIKKNKVGFVIKPSEESLIDIFFKVENNSLDSTSINLDRGDLKKILSMDKFVNNLKDITLS